MAALLSEFEYDIFVSYRQNDNIYDGWVTKFVENLQKELEAIFKTDQGIRQIFMSQDPEEQEAIAIKNGIPVQDNFKDYFPLSKEIDSCNSITVLARSCFTDSDTSSGILYEWVFSSCE